MLFHAVLFLSAVDTHLSAMLPHIDVPHHATAAAASSDPFGAAPAVPIRKFESAAPAVVAPTQPSTVTDAFSFFDE